jgi:multidrug efflux pump subunit AcrB
MVLAIGIVVDDAIVVLENVERIMREEHATPREAAIKAMQEVTSPIIAIVLTLTCGIHPDRVPRRSRPVSSTVSSR